MWLAVFCFFLGIVRDATATLFYRAVAGRRGWLAAHSGAVLTLIDIWVVAQVAISRNLFAGLTYAMGNWLGIFLAMKLGK